MASRAVVIFFKICYITAAVGFLHDKQTQLFYWKKSSILFGLCYQLLFICLEFFTNGAIARIFLIFKGVTFMRVLNAVDTISWLIFLTWNSIGLIRNSQALVAILNDLNSMQKALLDGLDSDFNKLLRQRIQKLVIFCTITTLVVSFNISQAYFRLSLDILYLVALMSCNIFTLATEVFLFIYIECVLEMLSKTIEIFPNFDTIQLRLVLSIHDRVIQVSHNLARVYNFPKLILLTLSLVMTSLYMYYSFSYFSFLNSESLISLCIVLSCSVIFLLNIFSCHFWHCIWEKVSNSSDIVRFHL